ncbi:MAG: 50S ribosomal protein L3 [Alphaproteobacteria bacterium]|nr:50S ribosomal protein L3 [Alphaproteobacteria bacterium]
MRVGLIAKKIGMSRFYNAFGVNHSATILQVNNCKIIDIKNNDKAGYKALRLSYGVTKKNVNKAIKGFLKKQNVNSYETSKEFRVNSIDSFKVGDELGVENFEEGQFVDISGNSIGKGFAGGMKRHNFAGNRATHGVSISHRSHGSTGQCQDPGKVFKGKKMAGRLGNVKKTVQNLLVLKIDKESNIIIIKGAVPGPKGSFLTIVDSVKGKKKIDLTKQKIDKTIDSSGSSKKEGKSKGDNPVEAKSENKNESKGENKPVEDKKSDNKQVEGNEGKD